MDRKIVYAGQIPLVEEFLQSERNTMVAISEVSRSAFGSSIVVRGLACTPTSPATLTVNVAGGSIYTLGSIDATDFGALTADTTHSILQQGINLDTTALTLVPPGTSGQAINYLIQAEITTSDVDDILLPYFNSANPAAPFLGPGDGRLSQHTTRKRTITLQAKAGTAATAGSQTTPSPDSGFTGLYSVTVAYGATALDGSTIARLSTAPFFLDLPSIPSTSQSGIWTYVVATGTANAWVLAPSPTVATYAAGRVLNVVAPATNTSTAVTANISALGTRAVKKFDGTVPAVGDLVSGQIYPTIDDGTSIRILATLASDILATASIVGRTQVFNSSGTFTVPAGVTAVEVEVIGAGGGTAGTGTGGGGGVAGNAAGGGGGGGYSKKKITGLVPGATVAVTVGAGGTNTSLSNGFGGTGGSSSFGAYCSATGGAGGGGGEYSSSLSGTAGFGTGGDVNVPGGTGGFSGPNTGTVTPSDAQRIVWRGGQTAGGLSVTDFAGSGGNGLGYGSGGNGGTGGSSTPGGVGAPGVVIVRW